MQLLSHLLEFPAPETTHASGIIAIGGDLSEKRLLLAYESGIFPWFEDGEPITWWCPEWRMVLLLDTYKPSKSLRNILNRNKFKVTFNTAFKEVITHCQQAKREGQQGTWITDDMMNAYTTLHESGKATSVEVWLEDELVGGLYGVDLGRIFCGESMFSKVSNASKIALHFLVGYLKEHHYLLLDGQVYNEHLDNLGFIEIHRDDFLKILHVANSKN